MRAVVRKPVRALRYSISAIFARISARNRCCMTRHKATRPTQRVSAARQSLASGIQPSMKEMMDIARRITAATQLKKGHWLISSRNEFFGVLISEGIVSPNTTFVNSHLQELFHECSWSYSRSERRTDDLTIQYLMNARIEIPIAITKSMSSCSVIMATATAVSAAVQALLTIC